MHSHHKHVQRSRPFIYADVGILNMYERCGFSLALLCVWRMRDLDEKNDKTDYKKLIIRSGSFSPGNRAQRHNLQWHS